MTGLRYESLPVLMAMMSIAEADQPGCLRALHIMEMEVISASKS